MVLLWNTNEFCKMSIIQQGGDTDTACAIYGAIQGYQNPYLLERLAINSFLNQESQTKLKRLMRQISL